MSNIDEQMKTATHKRITVQEVVDSGSAFASTEDGEMVFINQRIVAAMGVQTGDDWDAFLLPNYADEREIIPWRALRLASEDQEPRTNAPVDEKLLHAIVRLLNNDGYLTAAEIADTLDASVIEVHRALKNSHGIIMSVPAYFVP